MRTRFVPPNLSNYTPGRIVDECGEANAEFNRLKKLTDYLKTAIKARTSKENEAEGDSNTHIIKGETYCAVVSKEAQNRFDVGLAMEKGYLTEEQYAECFREIPMTVVRFEQFEPLKKEDEKTKAEKQSESVQ